MSNVVIKLDIPDPRKAVVERGSQVFAPFMVRLITDIIRRLGGQRANPFGAHEVSWNLRYGSSELQDLARQRTTGERASALDRRIALKAMREVAAALRNDVDNFRPSRLEWSAPSDSRLRLYQHLMADLGARYGYRPTLLTRAKQAVRRHAQRARARDGSAPGWYRALPYEFQLGRDVYERPSLVRRALEDALVAGGPAALGYAAAEGVNE